MTSQLYDAMPSTEQVIMYTFVAPRTHHACAVLHQRYVARGRDVVVYVCLIIGRPVKPFCTRSREI